MIKVLHIYGDLDVAGTQTVIMNYLRYFHKDEKIKMTLLINGIPHNSVYERECQQKGYSIVYSGYQALKSPKFIRSIINWLKFQFYLYREIKRIKPVIIHTHVTSSLPFVTLPILISGVKTWVHTLHSDPYVFPLHIVWLARFAFHCLGVYPVCVTEGQAQKAKVRYGIKKYSIIRNGIDIKRFTDINHFEVRQELGISEKNTVIGCVGRLDKIKNHAFLVYLFAEYAKINNDVILLLVGEGPEQENIEKYADLLGIKDKIFFTGLRNDVERMYKAMDIFMLTSFYESSSIVTVEAQIAGIRCVIADSIPKDVVITNIVNRISLNAPLLTWISAMNDELPHDIPVGSIDDFLIETSILQLKKLYVSLI